MGIEEVKHLTNTELAERAEPCTDHAECAECRKQSAECRMQTREEDEKDKRKVVCGGNVERKGSVGVELESSGRAVTPVKLPDTE